MIKQKLKSFKAVAGVINMLVALDTIAGKWTMLDMYDVAARDTVDTVDQDLYGTVFECTTRFCTTLRARVGPHLIGCRLLYCQRGFENFIVPSNYNRTGAVSF